MKKNALNIEKALIWIIAIIYLLVCIIPIIQLLSVTFSSSDRGVVSTFFPNSFSDGIMNIKKAIAQTGILRSLWQSLCYVSLAVVVMLIVSSLAAYEFACFKFPGSNIIFIIIISSLMLPMITYIIPLYRFVYDLGLTDTLIGLALPSIPSALAVFIIRQFLESIPKDLIEAAEIDGAGHFKIFFKIILPLMATPIITVTLIHFMMIWGSFLWPTLVAGTRWKPVSVTVAGAIGDGSFLEGRVKIATMLLSGIPPITVYLILQKYIIEGISTTGLKE